MPSYNVDTEKGRQDVQVENVSDAVATPDNTEARVLPGEVFPGITKESILAFLVSPQHTIYVY